MIYFPRHQVVAESKDVSQVQGVVVPPKKAFSTGHYRHADLLRQAIVLYAARNILCPVGCISNNTYLTGGSALIFLIWFKQARCWWVARD